MGYWRDANGRRLSQGGKRERFPLISNLLCLHLPSMESKGVGVSCLRHAQTCPLPPHTHTLIHAQKHTLIFASLVWGAGRQSQLEHDFIEANVRTSTHGRVKQDEAQKPTSSRLWDVWTTLCHPQYPSSSPFLFPYRSSSDLLVIYVAVSHLSAPK